MRESSPAAKWSAFACALCLGAAAAETRATPPDLSDTAVFESDLRLDVEARRLGTERLAQLVTGARQPAVRMAAARALSRLSPSERAFEALGEAVVERDPDVREAVIEAYAHLAEQCAAVRAGLCGAPPSARADANLRDDQRRVLRRADASRRWASPSVEAAYE